jgi:hypothetical protein
MVENELSYKIIGSAIEVHKNLGVGLPMAESKFLSVADFARPISKKSGSLQKQDIFILPQLRTVELLRMLKRLLL